MWKCEFREPEKRTLEQIVQEGEFIQKYVSELATQGEIVCLIQGSSKKSSGMCQNHPAEE